ncbi:DNA topoisomerase 2-like protein, partial [Tanacetum coccineum]
MTTPVKREIQTLWIWEDNRIIKRLVTFIPCLYRLFDEILLSAVHSKDCNIRVRLKEDIVSVWSNGDVLPNLGSSNFFEALQLLTQFTVQRANGEVVTEEVFTNIENKKIIRECNTTEKWTRVSFKPDIECLKDDTFTLMKRRVVDLAGSLARSASGKVDLHGTVLPNTFQEYVQLYPETSGTHSTRL